MRILGSAHRPKVAAFPLPDGVGDELLPRHGEEGLPPFRSQPTARRKLVDQPPQPLAGIGH